CNRVEVPDLFGNNTAVYEVTDDTGGANEQLVLSATFTVKGEINVQGPGGIGAGAEIWKAETSTDYSDVSLPIEWTYSGSVGNINITFDRDGDFSGADGGDDLHSDNDVTTSVAPDSETGACTAPSPGATETGGGCFVWAAGPNQDDLTAYGVSAAKFRIRATTVTPNVINDFAGENAFEVRGWYDLTGPVGADRWYVGETDKQIQWTTHGNGLGNVDVEYKVDTGSWTNITTLSAGGDTGDGPHSYTWSAGVVDWSPCPNGTLPIGCDKYQVRVIQANNINGPSAEFKVKPRIVALAGDDPVGYQTPDNFEIGEPTRKLQWTIEGTFPDPGDIDVTFSTNDPTGWGLVCDGGNGNGECTVCSGDANGSSATTGECTWSEVKNITLSSVAAFRAVANQDATDIIFTTSANKYIHGKFNVTAPLVTDILYPEENLDITWTEPTIANPVKVHVWWRAEDGFDQSWNKITIDGDGSGTTQDGAYDGAGGTNDDGPWPIDADLVHDNVQIRVTDALDVAPFYSAGEVDFDVVLRTRLLEPTAVTWKVGEKQDFRWAYRGDTAPISNVAIKYCLDGTITCGVPVTLIASVAANNDPADCTAPSAGELIANETGGCIEWDENIDAVTEGVGNLKDLEARFFIQDADDAACRPVDCAGGRPIIATSNAFIGSTADVKLIPRLVFDGIVPNVGG
ncbi:MAG: hypothetical protein V3R81_09230, partial [Gammaproteobacteria bacterium]